MIEPFGMLEDTEQEQNKSLRSEQWYVISPQES